MLYSFKCESCGWTGDRLCKIAERDEQVCNRDLGPGLVSGVSEIEVRMICDGKLVREVISKTANMSFQWANNGGGR